LAVAGLIWRDIKNLEDEDDSNILAICDSLRASI
jgi:hypothetical protein